MTKYETIKYIVSNWEKLTVREIAMQTGLKLWKVSSIAGRCRKAGIPLSKKNGGQFLAPDMVNELKTIYTKSTNQV